MVEWKKLGEVCGIFDGTHQTPKYTDSGIKFVSVENINDLYNSNKYISEEDYNANYKTKPQRNDVLMTRIGDVGSCAIVDHDEPLAYYVSLALLRPAPNVISGYIKYILGSHIGKVELRKRTLLTAVPLKINLGDVGKVCIPIPSLEEQTRIVGILDTFTSAIDNLKEQIAQRRKQYEYYRDQLLDLEGKEGVEMKKVAYFVKERILANELTAQNYTSVENLLKDKAGRKDAENVPSEGNWIRYQKGDVLIGNIRPYLRKIWLSDREGGTNGDVIVIRSNDTLLPEFMFYCLASDSFFLYYNQALKDGKMPRGEKKRVLSYVIPSIGKEEQQRIVSILDTFEASIQNLEAQLKEREKQYEYYRNKLLTFE